MAPPIQTIPTLNQNGMNMAVSSFVQASNTQKTAQNATTAKEIEHKSLQDKADMQVLKEAGQVSTLTASAIVNPYNEDEEKHKDQEFYADEDEESADTENSEELEDFDEETVSQEEEYSMQNTSEFSEQYEIIEEEASNEPFLGNVLNIKV